MEEPLIQIVEHNGKLTAKWQQEGFEMELKASLDPYAGLNDLDHLGRVLCKIEVRRDSTPGVQNEYLRSIKRFYVPNVSCSDLQREYEEEGFSTSESKKKATEQINADMERVCAFMREEWGMMCFLVDASFQGIVLGIGSLSGVEDDSGMEYFLQVTEELAREAIADARKAIAKIKTFDLEIKEG